MINTDCVEVREKKNHATEQLYDQVCEQVEWTVEYQVWEQVEDQVWDRLFWYSRFEVFE